MTQQYGQKNINSEGALNSDVIVTDFKAVGDGVTDDTQAIINAINSVFNGGGGSVYFPPGTYKCSGEIEIKTGVILKGDGIGKSIVDFSNADSDNFNNQACFYCLGTLDALPTIGSNVSAGDVTVTLASDVSSLLSAGDIFQIFNTTSGSWIAAAGGEGKAGEYCEVLSVSGAVISLANPTFGDYTTGSNIIVSKLNGATVQILDLEVVGIGDTSSIAAIYFQNGLNCALRNVKASGSKWVCAGFRRCYNSIADGLVCEDFQDTSSLGYGLAIHNSQITEVSNGYFHTARHGITQGGGASNGDMPVRLSNVYGSFISANRFFGADLHGNTEFCQYYGNTIIGGCTMGGRYNSYRYNNIYTSQGDSDGMGIVLGNMYGMDNEISGNTIIASAPISGSLNGIIELDRAVGIDLEEFGGVLKIVNNRIDMGDHDGDLVFIRNESYSSNDINVLISGNIFQRKLSPPSSGSDSVQIGADEASSKAWNSIVIENNVFIGCGIGCTNVGARRAHYRGNTIISSQDVGILHSANSNFPWTEETIVCEGNVILDPEKTGIRIIGSDQTFTQISICGNTSLRCAQDGTGSNTEKASIQSQVALQLLLSGNLIGDNQGAPTQTRLFSIVDVTDLVETGNTRVGTVTTLTLSSVTRHISRYATDGLIIEGYGTAPPVSGTWNQGDRIWNRSAAAGGTPGWICVTGGTPGTWKAMANLAV